MHQFLPEVEIEIPTFLFKGNALNALELDLLCPSDSLVLDLKFEKRHTTLQSNLSGRNIW